VADEIDGAGRHRQHSKQGASFQAEGYSRSSPILALP
jgi:hypothetical protein